MTVENGVTPIPPSAFYTAETRHLAANLGTELFLSIVFLSSFHKFYYYLLTYTAI